MNKRKIIGMKVNLIAFSSVSVLALLINMMSNKVINLENLIGSTIWNMMSFIYLHFTRFKDEVWVIKYDFGLR